MSYQTMKKYEEILHVHGQMKEANLQSTYYMISTVQHYGKGKLCRQ